MLQFGKAGPGPPSGTLSVHGSPGFLVDGYRGGNSLSRVLEKSFPVEDGIGAVTSVANDSPGTIWASDHLDITGSFALTHFTAALSTAALSGCSVAPGGLPSQCSLACDERRYRDDCQRDHARVLLLAPLDGLLPRLTGDAPAFLPEEEALSAVHETS